MERPRRCFCLLSVILAGDLLFSCGTINCMLTPRTITDLAIAATATAATASVLTHAAYSAQSQLFGPTIIAGNDPSEVALTYDDGPNDNATPALLEVLARHNVRATFFMIGKFARRQPGLVRQVHAAGHLIGNHTENHPWLTMHSSRQIHKELHDCNHVLEDILGDPIHYVRFPHGARRPATLRIARELGLKPVQWNAMGHDWQLPTAEAILARLNHGLQRARQANKGANILLHDGNDRHMSANRTPTVHATDLLLTRFALENKRCVTVDAWG
jgi:peptidoglycan/xylan/chitin deacetylase (PgdA/CDA1 family)